VTNLLAQKGRLLAEQIELGQRAADALEHTWSKVSLERIGESDPNLQEFAGRGPVAGVDALCLGFDLGAASLLRLGG
jgi:hypothetical protein